MNPLNQIFKFHTFPFHAFYIKLLCHFFFSKLINFGNIIKKTKKEKRKKKRKSFKKKKMAKRLGECIHLK